MGIRLGGSENETMLAASQQLQHGITNNTTFKTSSNTRAPNEKQDAKLDNIIVRWGNSFLFFLCYLIWNLETTYYINWHNHETSVVHFDLTHHTTKTLSGR